MDPNHSSYSYPSMNTCLSDETDTKTSEESGWTAYFEDFMVSQQKYHHNINHPDNQHDRPELSDAASHVDQWTNMTNSMNGAAPKFTKKLNIFKKKSKRTRDIRYDHSLEDTASSPVNSPRVENQHMGFNQIKADDIIEKSLGKGGDYEGETMEMVFKEDNNGSTYLKKRGLCLVPLSMFVNYI